MNQIISTRVSDLFPMYLFVFARVFVLSTIRPACVCAPVILCSGHFFQRCHSSDGRTQHRLGHSGMDLDGEVSCMSACGMMDPGSNWFFSCIFVVGFFCVVFLCEGTAD